MAIPIMDRGGLRPLIDADPVGLAVLWDRLYQQPRYREAYVVGDPPGGVLVMARARREGRPTFFALHAPREDIARELLDLVPPGFAILHLTDETPLGPLERRSAKVDARPAWLFSLDPEDFVDLENTPTRPLTPDWAPMIAQLWQPEWPAESYVRERILKGRTRGVYLDDQLVAWALTHFETDRVAMLGFFHVLDEQRRRGYGKAVATALTKDALARGKTPALHVFVDNEPSLNLVEAIGYRRVRRQVWGEAVLR